MKIKTLKLKNFRNYSELSINLNSKLNIFIGDNAQGKTNILESITVLALTKSGFNVKDSNLIKFGENFANISADVDYENTIKNYFIGFDEKSKKVKINNNIVDNYSDYISRIRLVLFSSFDINLFSSSPSNRRRTLNVSISQLYKNYLKKMQKFNFLLKKRNHFLKEVVIKGMDEARKLYFEILNKEFSMVAVDIVFFRKDYIDSINNIISKVYEEITGDMGLYLKYSTNIQIDDISSLDSDYFVKLLSQNYNKDIFYKMTLLGPHRDDYSFILNDSDLSIYGSQGQKRAAVLSLRLSEAILIKSVTGDYPILLLDDIFSELDIKKRNSLIKYVSDDMQTIITTTDLKMIDKSLIQKAKIFEIVNGVVKNVNKKEG